MAYTAKYFPTGTPRLHYCLLKGSSISKKTRKCLFSAQNSKRKRAKFEKRTLFLLNFLHFRALLGLKMLRDLYQSKANSISVNLEALGREVKHSTKQRNHVLTLCNGDLGFEMQLSCKSISVLI